MGLALEFWTQSDRQSRVARVFRLPNLPRGKNFRTRTTTRTLPPGVGLAIPSLVKPSRARKDGLEAVDRRVAAEAEVEIILGEVIPVAAERSDEAAEEMEAGPGWPM